MASEDQFNSAVTAISEATDDPLIRAKAVSLMWGYHLRWCDTKLNVLAVEEPFHLPIINPETAKKSRTFTQAGVKDGVVQLPDGRNLLLEHKTTSEDISDPDSPFWRRLSIDSQVSSYSLANWQEGKKLDGTLYDVVRKPGIRPKQITKKDAATIASLRMYCDKPVPEDVANDVAEVYRVGNTMQETPFLYSLRLGQDVGVNPHKYYARKIISRMDHEIVEFAGELWQTAKDIQLARRTGQHYRNSGACMLYNSVCEFLPLCSGHDEPTSDKWQPRQRNMDLDSSVLSHSRLRCFATCRRKHYYRYEMGIERADVESTEALHLGSALHKGWESWFRYLMNEREREENGDSSAVNAVAQRP